MLGETGGVYSTSLLKQALENIMPLDMVRCSLTVTPPAGVVTNALRWAFAYIDHDGHIHPTLRSGSGISLSHQGDMAWADIAALYCRVVFVCTQALIASTTL